MSAIDHREGLGAGAGLKRAVTEAHRLLDALLTTHLAALGLSIGEADLLTVVQVAAHDPVPSEIADWLGLTGAGTTGRLNTLERRGLIERLANPSDGRSVTVHLTSDGKKLAARVIDVKNTTVLETVIEAVGKKTSDRLLADLDTVIDALRDIADSP